VISSLFWRLFGWIRYRALWVVLGLLVLFLLIWYAGPLFAFGEFRPLETVKARCWLIGLICAIFLLRILLRRWYANRMNERVADMLRSALSPSTGTDENEERIDLLRTRFTEAIEVLRKARFEKTNPSLWNRVWQRRRYVYELPWYVIIGAPGVGKTTALLNSGLSFPLSEQIGAKAMQGAGGTRHCDWWFTNEAVFIDTAGRYTTHETDANKDKIEWRGFLSLLKKNRSHQPINGVLLMLSVSDLLELGPDERQAYAGTMRRRLDELRSDLGMTFPVYLMLNKCDLLLGFNEYFASLDRSGREQTWGFTLPLAPGKFELNLGQLTGEFAALQKRINAGLIDVLQAESDLKRRELIYTFPQQFSVLSLILQDTIKDLFTVSRFSETPLLRGVYFVSATQEGTPLDRIVNVLGQGFTVQSLQKPAVVGGGKAFFIQELLSKIVFGEAHIAGTNRRAERRSRAFHIAIYLFCIGLLGGAVLAWIASYRNNLTYIAEVEKKTDICEMELANFPEVEGSLNVSTLLFYLDMTAKLPDSIFFNVDSPLLRWTFGLYQGNKLKAGSSPLYHQILSRHFVPAIKSNMEQWLRTVDISDMELSYEVLKAYIMMHEPEHFVEEEFILFVETMWGYGQPEDALSEERNALLSHLKAAISKGMLVPVTPMDMSLVQSTRSRLSQYTSSQRVYHRLVRLLQNTQLPAFSVSSETGVQGTQVFTLRSGHPLTYGVPALYTYRGYHELFKVELDRVLGLVNKDESWVLGIARDERRVLNDIASGRLALDVKRHYMLDYISYWERYIDDITILAPRSLEQAARIVDLLSSVDSPLRRLLLGIARETTLAKEAAGARGGSQQQSIFDRAKRTVDSTANDLKRIVPQNMADSLGPKDVPEMWVNNRFAAIREFVQGGGKDSSNAPMQQAVKKLEELRSLLMHSIDNERNGLRMPETRLATEMELSAEGMPEPFKGIFKTAAAKSAQSIKTADRRKVNEDVAVVVTSFCRQAIEGKYPVRRSSSVDIVPTDFASVFGPDGSIEKFRQSQGPGTKFSVEFDRARVIRDVFFRNGNFPQVTFSIKPLVMDATITVLSFNIGEQAIRYDHGPRVPAAVTWPGGGNQNVTVTLAPVVENGVNSVTESGLWALHRLFDRHAQVQPGATPDVFNVTLDVGGRKATFEVRSSSVHNPFRLPEMENFSCPKEL